MVHVGFDDVLHVVGDFEFQLVADAFVFLDAGKYLGKYLHFTWILQNKRLKFYIVRDNVLVVPVFKQEAFGNHAELGKAELLVELEGRRVCRDNGVEL